ncbi:MAG: hypothetical protein WD055_00255 [Candidatus Dependentiae bacterium]
MKINKLIVVLLCSMSLMIQAVEPLNVEPSDQFNQAVDDFDDAGPDCCGALAAVGLLCCFGAFKVVEKACEQGAKWSSEINTILSKED